MKRAFENRTPIRNVVRERAMWRDLTKALQEVWRESGEPCSSYRPDKHYMRGPGPKWHAKYDILPTRQSPPSVPSAPVVQKPAARHA